MTCVDVHCSLKYGRVPFCSVGQLSAAGKKFSERGLSPLYLVGTRILVMMTGKEERAPQDAIHR